MNDKHLEIRAIITSMSPERAIDYISAFKLPEKEKTCIIEKDVNDLSYQQICDKYGLSHGVIKNARQRAYAKMADAIAYRKETGREQ